MKKIVSMMVLGSLIMSSIPQKANAVIAVVNKVKCEKVKKDAKAIGKTIDYDPCTSAKSMAAVGALYLFGGPIFGAVILGKAIKSHGVDKGISTTVSAIFLAITPIIGIVMLDESGNEGLIELNENTLPSIQKELSENALTQEEISAYNANRVELFSMTQNLAEETKDMSKEEAKLIAEEYKLDFKTQIENGDKALSALDKVLTASVSN